MEFVDYKCLETLLNEGEEIIVTEGIVSAIRGIIGRVFGMFKNFIDMIIRVFRNLIDRLKSKHSKKNSTQDQDQSNKSEVVPNKSEEPNKGSSAQVSTGFVKDITNATNSISSLTNTIYKSFDTVFKNFGTEDVSSELIDNLEDLDDVEFTDLEKDDFISYDSRDGKWKNVDFPLEMKTDDEEETLTLNINVFND